MSPLIVHHLRISQSERIPWLCEELGIDYELKLYKRNPVAAPPEYKALHPSGSAPIIQDGDLTLGESGAIVEYICTKYGQGKLFLKPSDPNYADFLYWIHYANGTLQPSLSRQMMLNMSGIDVERHELLKIFAERAKAAIKRVDERLEKNEYLAGNEFTAADIMSVWAFTNERYWCPYSLKEYPNIYKYIQRIGQRDAFKKAMSKAEPGLEIPLDIEPPKLPESY